MLSKENYEDKIENNILWTISKDARQDVKDDRVDVYKKKFVNLVLEYFLKYRGFKVDGENNFNLEFLQCLDNCIKSYEKDKGEFLHYFNFSFKNIKIKTKAKRSSDKIRAGIRVSHEDNRILLNIDKLEKKKNLDINSDKDKEIFMEILSLNDEQLNYYISLKKNTYVIEDNLVSEEDDNCSLLDKVADSSLNALDIIEEEENLNSMLNVFQRIYNECRESAKRKVSMIITMIILEGVSDSKGLNYIFHNYNFLDREMYKGYIEKGIIIKAKDIAQICGVKEADISRTKKNIIQKFNK